MRLLKDFRDFAMRGNVIDLAVGVIIGTAFGRIVDSLVKDILMPPIGKLIGNMDFTNLYFPLFPEPREGYPKTLELAKQSGSVIGYGNFLTITINFIIVAFCIFLVVKLMAVAQKRFDRQKAAEKAAEPPKPSNEELLLTDIRDILKQKATV